MNEQTRTADIDARERAMNFEGVKKMTDTDKPMPLSWFPIKINSEGWLVDSQGKQILAGDDRKEPIVRAANSYEAMEDALEKAAIALGLQNIVDQSLQKSVNEKFEGWEIAEAVLAIRAALAIANKEGV